VQRVRSTDELIAVRNDVFLLRERFAYFFVDPELAGYLVWGRVVADDTMQGVRIYRAVVEAGTPKVLSDYSGVEQLGMDSMDVAADALSRRVKRYRTIELMQAVIHPPGVLGTGVAGFLSAFPPGFAHASFASRADALRWLGRSDAAPAIDRLEELIRAQARIPDDVRQLRELLGQEGAHRLTLAQAARKLYLATRTLQLRLEQAGTSYREEVAAVRLALVEDRLRRDDQNLAAIAMDLGFTSAQHFSRWFRAQTGATPSEYRKQARERQ
jgi:AraC-like DNA-binding protein